MKTLKIFALSVAILTSASFMPASVPIIVNSGARHRALGNLCNHAQQQVRNGDLTRAMRNVESMLHADPKFWPALYVRAQIFSAQGKYELAIDSAVRYAQQALAVKNILAKDSKRIQRHLQLFEQHKPIRL